MDQEWTKDGPEIDQELKQKILDIIYYADWQTKGRSDGYTEKWVESENMMVQAIIETVLEFHSLATTARDKNE